jgi:hypothetical protein
MIRITLELHVGENGMALDWREFKGTADHTEHERLVAHWIKNYVSQGISELLKDGSPLYMSGDSTSEEFKAGMIKSIKKGGRDES